MSTFGRKNQSKSNRRRSKTQEIPPAAGCLHNFTFKLSFVIALRGGRGEVRAKRGNFCGDGKYPVLQKVKNNTIPDSTDFPREEPNSSDVHTSETQFLCVWFRRNFDSVNVFHLSESKMF